MPNDNNERNQDINTELKGFVKETILKKLPKELLDSISKDYIDKLVNIILKNKPENIDEKSFETMIDEMKVNIPNEVKEELQTKCNCIPSVLPIIAKKTDCPRPKCETACGETIVEEDICLLPLLLYDCALVIPYIKCCQVELKCPGTVIVCGLIRKFILYVGVTQFSINLNCLCYDIPFQCAIKDKDIKPTDCICIKDAQVLCAGWRPITKGTRWIWFCHCPYPVDVYGKIIDKELVKVNIWRYSR